MTAVSRKKGFLDEFIGGAPGTKVSEPLLLACGPPLGSRVLRLVERPWDPGSWVPTVGRAASSRLHPGTVRLGPRWHC